jgi:hypothetical protein
MVEQLVPEVWALEWVELAPPEQEFNQARELDHSSNSQTHLPAWEEWATTQ